MRGSRFLTVLFVGMLAMSMVAPAASAALNHDAGEAPNPMIKADTVEVANHDRTSMDSPLEYENDNGELETLPAVVNKTNDYDEADATNNPYSVIATDIDEDEFGAFPRTGTNDDGEQLASALNAGEWSVGGSNSSKISTSNTETAPNVEAVQVATDGSMGSGDVAHAEYNNWTSELDSDEEKRFLQLAVDVSTLDSGATVDIQVRDEDGDYKNVTIDSSADESSSDVLANSTGEGDVIQVQLGDLTTRADSDDDGFDNIETLRVEVSDADATVDFALINLEKTSPYKFGVERVDTDGDEELEDRTIEEPHGRYSMKSLDSMGSTFDDSTLNDLQFPAHFRAADVTDSDVKVDFRSGEDNSFPNWDVVAEIHYRINLPDAYDLSYSGVEMVQTTNWPSERYVTAESKEGVGDTDFSDIDNWSSFKSSIDSEDQTITIDSTVSSGTEYATHYELKLTSNEADAMQAATGGAAPMGDSGGGLWGFITSVPGIIMSLIGSVLSFRWLKG